MMEEISKMLKSSEQSSKVSFDILFETEIDKRKYLQGIFGNDSFEQLKNRFSQAHVNFE